MNFCFEFLHRNQLLSLTRQHTDYLIINVVVLIQTTLLHTKKKILQSL